MLVKLLPFNVGYFTFLILNCMTKMKLAILQFMCCDVAKNSEMLRVIVGWLHGVDGGAHIEIR